MSTEAVEKFRARAAALNETLGRKLSSREIEVEVQRRAERADRDREENRGKKKEERRQEETVTIVDRYGNRSVFKEKDCPVK